MHTAYLTECSKTHFDDCSDVSTHGDVCLNVDVRPVLTVVSDNAYNFICEKAIRVDFNILQLLRFKHACSYYTCARRTKLSQCVLRII